MKDAQVPKVGAAWRVRRRRDPFGFATVVRATDAKGRRPTTGKAMEKALDRIATEGLIGATAIRPHVLSGCDLEEYGVLAHLHRIAAAYQKGDKFDALLAAWEAELPIHPAEGELGLTGYRKVVEGAEIADIPSVSD